MIIKRFTTGFVTGSLLLATVLPAAADTYVKVQDNGAKSDTEVKVEQECKQEVHQGNMTTAGVMLYVGGNSGGNEAKGNTGGDVKIKTGDVTNDVSVTVKGGNNTADVPDCCCGVDGNDQKVVVKDNGYRSDNEVKVESEKKTEVDQHSFTAAKVYGDVYGNTGKNKAKYNTKGANKVKTGKVKNTVKVRVVGGDNELNP